MGERLDRARHAFAGADFSAAIAELEAVPEIRRTTEIAGLLRRSRFLQKVAETVQPPRASETTAGLVSTARALIDAGRHAEAIAHLELIPKAERTPDESKLLRQALAAHRHDLQQRTELQQQWQRAVRSESAEAIRRFRPKVVALLERDPDDDSAIELLDLIDRYDVHAANRAEKFAAAQRAYDRLDFSDAIRQLNGIHCDLWTQRIYALYRSACRKRAEAQKLSGTLYHDVVESPSPNLNEPITEMEALGDDPAALLREGLPLPDNVALIRALIDLAASHAKVPGFCKQVVTRLQPDEYQALLAQASCESDFVPGVLNGLFGSLIERPVREIRQHIRALADVSHVLQGQDAVLYQRWHDFLQAVDDFDGRREREWTWRDTLLENERTEQLADSAEQLAVTADRVLPAEGDRMQRLMQMLEIPPPPRFSLLSRVLRRIRRYLETRSWKTGTVAVLSFGVATRLVVGGLGLTATGLAARVFYSLVFELGNATACLVGGALVALWASFGVIANKLL